MFHILGNLYGSCPLDRIPVEALALRLDQAAGNGLDRIRAGSDGDCEASRQTDA